MTDFPRSSTLVEFCGCDLESVFTPAIILIASGKVVDFDGDVVDLLSFAVVGSYYSFIDRIHLSRQTIHQQLGTGCKNDC